MSENPTQLSISVSSILGKTFAPDYTVIDLDIHTHLRTGNNGILSSLSQHFTLDEAKELVARMNKAIAEVELELLENE